MKNFSKIVDNFDVTTKKYVDDGLAEKANSSDLATVATSGSYNDLSNKPTIPAAANNGTLTIQKNGTNVATFGANQSTNATANITVPTKASDVDALSLDGGTIKKSKTIKMDASANSDGANLKWGTVNSKNPYIGYASDQVDGTFVIGSLLGTNYASGLAIGGGSGNLLWKGTKVATTSDIPTVNNGTLTIQKNGTTVATFSANQSGNATANITVPTKVSELTNDSGYTTNKGTVTQVKINGTTKSPDSTGLVDLGTVGGSSDNSKHGYTQLTNENLDTIMEAGWYRAASGNTCTNKPIASTAAFILVVEKTANEFIKQTLFYTPFSSLANYSFYCRISNANANSWIIWQQQQTLCSGVEQFFSGRKLFDSINISDSLQFTGDAGSNGQFAMSQGGSSAPKWVNLQVKVNGTTYTPDNNGLIDLGTISGGGSTSKSPYNDIY